MTNITVTTVRKLSVIHRAACQSPCREMNGRIICSRILPKRLRDLLHFSVSIDTVACSAVPSYSVYWKCRSSHDFFPMTVVRFRKPRGDGAPKSCRPSTSWFSPVGHRDASWPSNFSLYHLDFGVKLSSFSFPSILLLLLNDEATEKHHLSAGGNKGGIMHMFIFILVILLLRWSWDKGHANHISTLEWPEAWLPVNTMLL